MEAYSNITKGLSAGRVQSTLLRMLQDHENSIKTMNLNIHMILLENYMMMINHGN